MEDYFEEIRQDHFKRIDAIHPIDWRYNDCIPPTKLALISKKKPLDYPETKGVHVEIIDQNKGKYAVVFVLSDPSCAEPFHSFCEDAIESSRNIDPGEATDFAFDRFLKWIYLFMPHRNDKLSDIDIRGLIGELYVLKSRFIPVYGAYSSLRSWMNKKKGKQDFIEYDKWYEIKTLLEGNDAVCISSLEQLSRTDDGQLVVVNIKKSSPESEKRVTLNTLYNDILGLLSTFALKQQFDETMLDHGYVPNDPYYDNHCFEMINVVAYGVVSNFPRLTPDNLPYVGISRAKYEILIDAIKDFEVDKWN